MLNRLSLRRPRSVGKGAHEVSEKWFEEILGASLRVALEEQARWYEEQLEAMGVPRGVSLAGPAVEQSGAVRADWRTELPPAWLLQNAIATNCPDCTADVVISEHRELEGHFELLIAHDETCRWQSGAGFGDLDGEPDDG